MNTPEPLISCLLVTPATTQRFELLQQSIAAYKNQTYASRELVIVLDTPTAADFKRLQDAVNGSPDIRLIEVKEKISLGALRNRSIQEAQGEILCQWDDDDLYHPTRLQYQYEAMTQNAADAVYLQNVFHLFPKTNELFWTNWSYGDKKGHPATVMCKKDFGFKYPEEGDKSQKGEDVELQSWLRTQKKVCFLANPVYLYTYVFHGTNTWHYEHHKALAARYGESRTFLQSHGQAFALSVKEAALPYKSLLIMDPQGLVWVWVDKNQNAK